MQEVTTDPKPTAPPAPRQLGRVLMAAAREGLLEYRGPRGSGQFDVVICETARVLPQELVRPTVDRLREICVRGREYPLRLVASDGRRYTMRVMAEQGRVVEVVVPGDHVPGFIAGYVAARTCRPAQPRVVDAMSTIRDTLQTPDLDEQIRLHLLALMTPGGSEPGRVSKAELARRIGVTVKTVAKYLKHGEWLPTRRADDMARAMGQTWRLGVGPSDGDGWPDPGTVPPPAPKVARLFRLLAAHDAGQITYGGPTDPTAAREARVFELRVGGGPAQTVAAADVNGWLDGVAAHAGVVADE